MLLVTPIETFGVHEPHQLFELEKRAILTQDVFEYLFLLFHDLLYHLEFGVELEELFLYKKFLGLFREST